MTPLDPNDDDSPAPILELPLLKFQETPRRCSYLPDETASLEYRYLLDLSPGRYQQYLEAGWRRFGRVVFRPRCPTCRACRGLRIDVVKFAPTKSQRRCMLRNNDVTLQVQPATATGEHVALFNAYHRHMQQLSGWPEHIVSLAEYQAEFADPAVTFAWETLYHCQGRLVGVGLVDVLDQGLSSVYFYHDPAWRQQGPGTYSILRELAWARELQVPFLYLGYWIERCPSMAYKNRFRPHELLMAGVEPGQPSDWKPANPDTQAARPDQPGNP